MIRDKKKEKDCKNRKEYLVRLAVEYIRNHTGFMGMDDDIFYDNTKCDGYALANDLIYEFELDDLEEM